MSALARYFLHVGKKVAGYDRTPSHLTDELSAEGAAVHFEDDVRLKEKAQAFDDDFVRLARSVYIENDERARIKKAINLESGSGVPNKTKVGKITREQLQKIAELKMPDLNAANIDTAISMIAGTARSMGVEVEG